MAMTTFSITTEAIFHGIMQIAVIYFAYKFYVLYQSTNDKIFLGLFSMFAFFTVVHLPYLIWHRILLMPFAYGEQLHGALFLISVITIGWAELVRARQIQQLEAKRPEEGRIRKAA